MIAAPRFQEEEDFRHLLPGAPLTSTSGGTRLPSDMGEGYHHDKRAPGRLRGRLRFGLSPGGRLASAGLSSQTAVNRAPWRFL